MKKIFLVGRGHLGGFLKARWGLEDKAWFSRDLETITPFDLMGYDVLVNCAAKTDLPWCEANPGEAFRCNAIAPLKACRAAGTAGVRFVHISSGCVWDGPYRKDGKPFEPQDPPSPQCVYTWTKVAGDAMMLDEPPEKGLLILRPRQVYSPVNSQRNTLYKLLKYGRLLDTPNSMTSADTIAKTIEVTMDLPITRIVLNVYDRGVITPFKVGQMMAAHGLRAEPERLLKSDLDSWHKPKRVDTVLYDDLFEKIVDPPPLGEEIERNIMFMPGAKPLEWPTLTVEKDPPDSYRGEPLLEEHKDPPDGYPVDP